MMKVSFLMMSASRNAGGIYFAVQPLAQSLSALDCDCRIIAPHDEFTDTDREAWSPVGVHSYKTKGPKSLGFSSEIKGLIGCPDIQHVHGIWMYQSRVNRITAHSNNVPYIVSPHGMLDKWAVENSRWKKKTVGWLYENRHLREADCIHALCESEAKSIRDFGLKNPICIIPNGIDLPRLDYPIDDLVNKTKKRLLFIGRIHPKKGLHNLISAFAKLDQNIRKNWELLIAGWDQNYQSELEAQTAEMGVSDNVIFSGPQFGEQKEKLMRSCDAFVLPSFSEGLPMSVLEAWSYALPTLITSACNLPEGCEFKATIQCEPNELSIEKGLYELLTLDDRERQLMGKRARTLTEEKFNWPVVSAQMHEVYRWLLKETPPPQTVRFD